MSSYVGRYHRVRPFGAQGHGHPYVLDRHKGLLTPYQVHGEHEWWWHARQRRWVPMFWNTGIQDFMPILQGGIGFQGSIQLSRPYLGSAAVSSLAQTTFALNSAYIYASGGDAVTTRFSLLTAKTLTDVYFYITGYTGTASNVNDIDVEVRNHSTNKPGSTLHATMTKDPASATGWIKVSGFSFAMSADTLFWIVIADPDGGAIDFATILRNTDQFGTGVPDIVNNAAFQSTDGFVTAAVAANRPGDVVLVFNDGSVIGNSISGSAAPTSSTNQKGWYISGLTEQLKIWGLVGLGTGISASGMNIWSGSNGPAGTPDATGTVSLHYIDNSPTLIGRALSTPYAMEKSTIYRIVYTFSAASGSPNKYNIGTGNDANLRAVRLGGGSFYWAEANGTTNWANDDQNAQPAAMLLIEDQVPVSGSGGGRMVGGRLAA